MDVEFYFLVTKNITLSWPNIHACWVSSCVCILCMHNIYTLYISTVVCDCVQVCRAGRESGVVGHQQGIYWGCGRGDQGKGQAGISLLLWLQQERGDLPDCCKGKVCTQLGVPNNLYFCSPQILQVDGIIDNTAMNRDWKWQKFHVQLLFQSHDANLRACARHGMCTPALVGYGCKHTDYTFHKRPYESNNYVSSFFSWVPSCFWQDCCCKGRMCKSSSSHQHARRVLWLV